MGDDRQTVMSFIEVWGKRSSDCTVVLRWGCNGSESERDGVRVEGKQESGRKSGS